MGAQARRLRQNNQAIETAIKDVITNHTSKSSASKLQNDGLIKVNQENLKQQIDSLYIEQDRRRGVTSDISILPSGERLFIRDAREITPSESASTSACSYAIMGYSYLMAAIVPPNDLSPKQLEDLGKQAQSLEQTLLAIKPEQNESSAAFQQRMRTKLLNFVNVIAQEKSKAAANNGKSITPEQASKDLDKLRKWIPLEFAPTNFVTISNFKDKNNKTVPIVQIERPLTILTKDQQADIQKLGTKDAPQWFKDLPTKQLQDYVKTKMSIDPKYPNKPTPIFPSQTRGVCMGGKNQFLHEIGKWDQNGFTSLSHNIHVGAIPHYGSKIEKENKRVTNMNQEQFLQMCTETQDFINNKNIESAGNIEKKEHKAVMISLNSVLADKVLGTIDTLKRKLTSKKEAKPYFPEDTKIANQTRIRGVKGFSAAKIPLNATRYVEHIDFGEIKKHVKDIIKNLPSNEEYKKLSPARQVKVKAVYDKAKSLQKIMTNSQIGIGERGLAVTRLFNETTQLYNQHIVPYSNDRKVGYIVAGYGCASGNNRTGFAEYCNDYATLRSEFGITLQPGGNASRVHETDAAISLQTTLANSYHMQITKGYTGILGGDGGRKKSAGTLPEFISKEAREKLISAQSDIKDVDTLKPKPNKKAKHAEKMQAPQQAEKSNAKTSKTNQVIRAVKVVPRKLDALVRCLSNTIKSEKKPVKEHQNKVATEHKHRSNRI